MCGIVTSKTCVGDVVTRGASFLSSRFSGELLLAWVDKLQVSHVQIDQRSQGHKICWQ